MHQKTKMYKQIFIVIVFLLLVFESVSTAQHSSSFDHSNELENTKMIDDNRTFIDISDLCHGIIKVKVVQNENQHKLKTIIEKDKERYTYDLNSNGNFEPYPLQMGNGKYSVKVLENVIDNRYAVIFGTSFDLTLANDKAPFLSSHQIVRYDENSRAVSLASEITQKVETDKEKIEAVCQYIVNNIAYDYQKADTVEPGYLPDCDRIIESGKGICFDYASLFAVMLRSLNIPAKLVTGYVAPDYLYHAWNEVYIEGTGWVRINQFYSTYKEGAGWLRVDTTFAAGTRNSHKQSQFMNDDDNYIKKLEY